MSLRVKRPDRTKPANTNFCVATPLRVSLLFASIANDFSVPDTLASSMSGSFTFLTHNVHLMLEVVEESVYRRVVGNDVRCRD